MTTIPKLMPLKFCDACVHKNRPDGGHCYMFKENPPGAHCAKFEIDPAAKHAAKQPRYVGDRSNG